MPRAMEDKLPGKATLESIVLQRFVDPDMVPRAAPEALCSRCRQLTLAQLRSPQGFVVL
jgi:hypothetical protein